MNNPKDNVTKIHNHDNSINSINSINANSYLQTAEREIIVNSLRNKVKIRVKSVFAGEQTFADKLFAIADRKLKNE